MRKKEVNKEKNNSLSEILNPMMNYLVSIENNLISDTESVLVYTLGVPKNWIMETDMVFTTVLKQTHDLTLIKLEPSDRSTLTIDEFYNYVVNLITKNLQIDQKRIELESEIIKLKNKFQVEQDELISELYNKEDELETDEGTEDNTNKQD